MGPGAGDDDCLVPAEGLQVCVHVPGPCHVSVCREHARLRANRDILRSVSRAFEFIEHVPLRRAQGVDDAIQGIGGFSGMKGVALAGPIAPAFVETQSESGETRYPDCLTRAQSQLDAAWPHVRTVCQVSNPRHAAQSGFLTWARATASALMLTRPRTVTDCVSTCTDRAAPNSIGPMVTPPPRILRRL